MARDIFTYRCDICNQIDIPRGYLALHAVNHHDGAMDYIGVNADTVMDSIIATNKKLHVFKVLSRRP